MSASTQEEECASPARAGPTVQQKIGVVVESATEGMELDQSETSPTETPVKQDTMLAETFPELDPEVVTNLSQGVLDKLQPDLQKSRTMLSELTENQRILIETIQQENAKFTECQAYTEVFDTMEKAKLYHTKLLNIKKEMTNLHDKSAKLKKRALRIQQQKNKEVLEREQTREQELEKERMLIAKLAKKSS